MGSLFGTLGIALGALQADRGAIEVTSNNIANVNTPGYSREQFALLENSPVQVGSLLFGTGVTQGQTVSIRDNLLEQRLDQENQSSSQLNAFLGAMNQVQVQFNETAGSGLQGTLTAFFNSLSQLATDPTNASFRQGVITAGQNLASAFQQISSNLHSLQSNTDLSAVQSVTQVNQLTQQIAALNVQISGLVSVGQDAGTFIDQRTQLIRQLSGLVNISETNAGNDSLTISIPGGAPLVDAGESFAISTQVNAVSTFHDIYSGTTDITSAVTSGSLGGLIQARDQAIPGALTQLDTLAYNLETSFNTQSRAGFDGNGNPGVNFFSQPSTMAGAASSFAVAISDPNLVAASSDGTVGSNGNAQALINLQNQTIVNGQTPLNYYSNLVFDIGNQVSQAQSEQQAVSLLQQQLQDQRGAISGVSLDEEAVNLIRLQSAYQASSNVVNVINQLLTVILGHSEFLLRRDESRESSLARIKEIRKAAERGAWLTNRLLAYSRNQTLKPGVLQINSVLEDMDGILRTVLGEDISLDLVMELNLGWTKVDSGQLQQIVLNLAANARDAMPRGGRLRLETFNRTVDSRNPTPPFIKPGEYVGLLVQDTGTGMDSKTRERIFEPFFTTKEVGKGTGLGLSTVYGIVKQSGGYIWVESELNAGSSFHALLPRVAPPAESGVLQEELDFRSGGEVILLVEDDPAVRRMAVEVLRGSGYSVLVAPSGADALQVAAKHKGQLDLLLTDVVMPGMTGPELVRHFVLQFPRIPILYMSGYTDDAIEKHGVRGRAVKVLQKPFTHESLARGVREALRPALRASLPKP